MTFHARDINATLVDWTGRPYKFVHVVRDPVDMVVSAYLYETQRATMVDPYQRCVCSPSRLRLNACRTIRNLSQTEGLLAMSAFMQKDLLEMEQQYVMTAADHNGLNMKLEDFGVDFSGTVQRMFEFLCVPAMYMDRFLRSAAREVLQWPCQCEIDSNSQAVEWQLTLCRIWQKPRRFGHQTMSLLASMTRDPLKK